MFVRHIPVLEPCLFLCPYPDLANWNWLLNLKSDNYGDPDSLMVVPDMAVHTPAAQMLGGDTGADTEECTAAAAADTAVGM